MSSARLILSECLLLVVLQGCAMLGRDFQRVHIEKKCEVTLTRGGAKYGQPDNEHVAHITVGDDCTVDVKTQDEQNTPEAESGRSDG